MRYPLASISSTVHHKIYFINYLSDKCIHVLHMLVGTLMSTYDSSKYITQTHSYGL